MYISPLKNKLNIQYENSTIKKLILSLPQWHCHIIVWSEKFRHNIRWSKPYKYDTNVEDINPQNMYDDVII